MTITDKEFIKRVCEKAGIETFEYKCDMCENLSIRNRHCPRVGGFCFNWDVLDYNILMTAVENINKSDGDLHIQISKGSVYVNNKDYDLQLSIYWKQYDSLKLALQHALLYIMENEK